MFLGLAVFIVLAVAAYVIILRAVKALFRLLTSQQKKPEKQDAKQEKKTEKKGKDESLSESRAQSRQERIEKEQEPDSEDEQTRLRHEGAIANGITESFSSDDSGFSLDPKAIADRCTESSGLTYLEFNNREIAGADYFGFNLIIEKDTRMALTYNGQAVASLTKDEVKSTAIINGQEVEGTAPAWRINTFPPFLSPGMVTSDLAKMLSAADSIKACGKDPAMVADKMVSVFIEPGNVSRLKYAVDRKIQEKESAYKSAVRETIRKEPIKHPIGIKQ